MKHSQKTILWFIAATLMVMLGIALTFWSYRQINEAAALRMHTASVLRDANNILSELKDAETGQRGFLLTGDEAFLQPYLAVRNGIEGRLESLRQLTAIEEAQKHLDTMTPLVAAKMEEMRLVVALNRNKDMAAALAIVSSGEGKVLMDSIRSEMASFTKIEETSRAEHDAAFQSNMLRLFSLIVIASLFTLFFALMFAYLFYRQAQQRIKDAAHLETQHSLEIQEDANIRLQNAYFDLQISEEKFSVTLNSIGDGVIATDADGKVTFLNPHAETLTGWKQKEILGHPIDDIFNIINQETRLPSVIPVKDTLVHGTIHSLANHTLLIARNGKERAIADSCSPIRNRDGEVIGAVLVFRDVTKEYALQKAGALQNAIFNSANFSSIATDAKGVIQIFNVGAERMLGYAAADVMNKITPADISDPQEVIARAEALSIELSTPITPGFEALVFKASRGIEDIYELTYIRKDGSRFPAVVSVTALRDAQNDIIGYLLIGTDNTARKQIEAEQQKLDQRLRDQQFYTRSLIESNIDAIVTTDPSGVISDVNKQMEALTGCTRDELIGAPVKNYFTDPERADAAIKRVLNEKKITNYELTARARDGKETVVSYNATTFYDRDRKLQGVFAAARDITERKQLDLVLQEKNVELEGARLVAEKANLAKSDFLSSMSHELRSPLNAILGFAQLMESDAPTASAAQKESVAQILQAGWHLLKLINEILDLAKVESRQVPLSEEPVSLSEVMLECQGMVEPQLQQRGIQLNLPKLDIPYFVSADRTRLKQVIINLLTNAIKYNTKQGRVDVNFDAKTDGRTRVSIRDTGAGLSAEHVVQLFQPFNRLGQEAGGEEGTGIGLVVAKRLVELMGGTIGVESEVGVGSVFWFELNAVAEPLLVMEEVIESSSPKLHVSRSDKVHTLLYVEDNPANLKLVEQIISRHADLRLLTAVNGTIGIELARDTQPDVILMDINLPGISGFEVLNILQADPLTAHIPVIAVSANAMQLDIEKGIKAGFFLYMTKPIKVNELREALDVALVRAAKQTETVDMET